MIVPVYNEAEQLERGLATIVTGLAERFAPGDFEVVVVENGSTDGTKELCARLDRAREHLTKVQFVFCRAKGLGLAYKKGIDCAKFNDVLLSAIDLPFGFSDVDQLVALKPLPDSIFFSKAHKASVTNRQQSRKVASYVLNTLLRLMFAVKLGDTQGSIYLNRLRTRRVVDYADAPDLFFTAQLGIYATRSGLTLKELPIVMPDSGITRKSKFHPVQDGIRTLTTLLSELPRYYNYAHD